MTNPIDQSAEQLRLALPLISKHGANFEPESYALWFHFVKVGASASSVACALDAHVQAGSRLTVAQTQELFRTLYPDAGALEQVREAFVQMMSRMANSATEVNVATGAFATELDDAAKRLAGASGAAQIEGLVAHAQQVARTLAVLRERINESQTEVSTLRDQLQQVRRQALTDALTQLVNRRAFDDAIAQLSEQARQTGLPLSLVMIDVDHFKRINDTMGHLFGDRVLQAVAQTLHANVKGKDMAARYGGEEFAVLLPETHLADAAQVAARLLQAVRAIRIRRAGSDAVVANLTVSGGVATLGATEACAALIDRVDAALYEAKRRGRDQVVVSS